MKERERSREHRSMERKLCAQIEVRGADDCWLWTGRVGNRGYGIKRTVRPGVTRRDVQVMTGRRLKGPFWRRKQR